MLKSAAAGLVNHVLVGKGVQLRDDIVSCFTTDEKSAQWSFVADSEA